MVSVAHKRSDPPRPSWGKGQLHASTRGRAGDKKMKALPCSASVDGQDPDSSAFDWFSVANQGQCFPHSGLQRQVSGLAQTQQARQHPFLKKVTIIHKT
ncbi:hypothetical protein EYF80_016067 [Liparis tanakae]|uniref:Uncharacterized protein n=1 Tax=Liparis tanakae TaxID=230148 RepID=A0A4Z2I6M0_9TELE|nr:hypothetical protein EYF80_016067 [Liparis tanakae]